jgi:hypothetical protein
MNWRFLQNMHEVKMQNQWLTLAVDAHTQNVLHVCVMWLQAHAQLPASEPSHWK